MSSAGYLSSCGLHKKKKKKLCGHLKRGCEKVGNSFISILLLSKTQSVTQQSSDIMCLKVTLDYLQV